MKAKLCCVLTVVALLAVSRWGVADGHDLRQQQQSDEDLYSAVHAGRQKRAVTARWSSWFNGDRPWIGQGDFETTDTIQKHYSICGRLQHVVSAQCRVAGTNDTFDSTTADRQRDRLLQGCTTHGLVCLNIQQPSGKCQDYQVRFLCQDVDDSDSGSIFPNFDFKIYLILIAIPLVIIIFRVVWGCCCKNQFKNRRQNQRSQRSSVTSSLSSSSDDDNVTIDPALANPPPSYSELFGSVRSNVFAISGGLCLGHSKCLQCEHAAIHGLNGQAVTERSQVVNTMNTEETASSTGSQATQSTAADTSENADLTDEVFSSESSNTTVVNMTSSNVTTSDNSSTQNENRIQTLPTVASSNSLVGAVAGSSSTTQPAPQRPHCACPCHNFRGGMPGVDNLAFHWDSSDFVGAPVAPLYPGMHQPVFLFHRNSSVTSFTELPDYEQALEILKKKEGEPVSIHL